MPHDSDGRSGNHQSRSASSSSSHSDNNRGHNLSSADRSKGGSMSGGNFKYDRDRASEAGREGGKH